MIRSFFKPSALLRNRLQNSFGSALPGVLRKGGWEKAWQHRITPWDAGKATPVIQNMLLKYANLPKGNVLVVGCGAGYDAIEFAKTGYNTLGVDLAPTALRLANENARAMEMEGKKQGKLVFQQADIFNFFPDPSWGTFSIVFDYTMMAALEPSVWLKYLQRLRSLVAPDGEFVLLMFPVGDHKYGPPYAMNPDEYVSSLPFAFMHFFVTLISSFLQNRTIDAKGWMGDGLHRKSPDGV